MHYIIAVVLSGGGGEREVNIIPFDKWGGGGGYNFNCQCRFKYNTTKSCSILEVSLINNNKISDLLLFVEFSLSMHSIETLVSNYIYIVYDFNHGHQQLIIIIVYSPISNV